VQICRLRRVRARRADRTTDERQDSRKDYELADRVVRQSCWIFSGRE